MSTESPKVQLGFGVDSTVAEQGVDRIEKRIGTMADRVAAAGEKAGQGVQKIAAGVDDAAKKTEAATTKITAAIKRLTNEQERLAAGPKGSAAFLEVQARQMGLNTEAIKPLLVQLEALRLKNEEANRALNGGAGGLNNLGMSARATAAAMRQVPAQFQDIIVSLQAGQAPMTVLLQQGSQLSTVFGGVGPAARAVGGHIAGMITPLTVAAAALAGIGFALHEASERTVAYNRALILSGNASGTTANQLRSMADAITQTGLAQSAATDAITQFARAGDVGASSLQRFSQVAIEFERNTGQAVKETVQQFADLAKAPLAASLKLNEAYNYLTPAVYKQIKALDDEGKMMEAVAVAQNAFADAQSRIGREAGQNMGFLSERWRFLKDQITEVTNLVARLAGGQTAAERGIEQRARLTALIAAQAGAQSAQPTGRQLLGRFGVADPAVERAAEISRLQEEIRMASLAESRAADAASMEAAQKRKVDALKRYDAEFGKYDKTEKERVEAAIKRARTMAEEAGKLFTPEIERRMREDLEKKPPKGATSPRIAADAFDTEVLRSYAKALDDFGNIANAAAAKAEDLSKTQAKLREIQASPTWAAYSRQQREQVIYLASIAQGEEDRTIAAKQAEDVMRDVTRAMEEGARVRADAVRAAEQAAIAAEAELANYGLLKSQIQELTLEKLKAAKESAALAGEDVADIEKRIDAQKRLIAATRGVEVKDANEKAAKDAAAEWQRTADSINSSLTDALLRGFESGKGFARNLRDTIVNMFKTLVLRPIISAVMSPVSAGINSIVQPITSGITQSIGGNAAGSMFGSSMLGGLGMFGQAAGATLSNGIISGFGANMGNIATLLQGGQLMGALGAAMPYIGIAFAAISLFSKKRGGPKDEVGEGFGIGGTNNKPVWADAQAKTITDGIEQSWVALGKSLGVSSILDSGVFVSRDPKGTALTQVQVTGGIDGRSVFNRRDRLGGIENVGREDGAVEKVLAEETIRVLYAGLLESDLKQKYKDFLLGLVPDQETAETLQKRIDTLTGVKQFQDALENLPFANLSALSVQATADMGAFAGSLQNLAAGITSYYANFFSAEEQRIQTGKNIQRILNEAGGNLTLDNVLGASRQNFRRLVEAQDLTTEAGRRMYAALMLVAPMFASITPGLDDVSASLKDVGDSAEEAARKLAEAARNETDRALRSLERSTQVRRGELDAARQAAQSIASEVGSVFEAVKNASRDLFNEVATTQQMRADEGRSFIQQALDNARATGYLPDSKKLNEAITAATQGIGSKPFKSALDRDFEKLVLANQLRELEKIAGPQLTAAERAVKFAEEQIEQLDKTLDYWRDAVALARDQIDATTSVETAVKRLADALIKEKPGAPKPATPTTTSTGPFTVGGGSGPSGPGAGNTPKIIWTEFQDFFATYGSLDNGPARVAQYLKAYGETQASAAAALNLSIDTVRDYFKRGGIPAFASGGMHAGGWAMVGEQGPELAYMPPARIYSAADTKGAVGNSVELLAEVKLLREKVEQLGLQTVVNTRKSADVLDRWSMDAVPTKAA